MDKNFTFEVNPNHEIMVNLNKMRKQNQKIASMLIR